jgi:hypothetical protein
MIHATLLALALAAPVPQPPPAPSVCVLSASTSTVSASAGGSQFLQLQVSHWFGVIPPHPEFFGSLGTTPGVRFNGVKLPLNVDRYFFAAYHGGKFLQPYAGFDLSGTMTAELRFPAGMNQLAGVTLYHAFTADDPLSLLPLCASNAVAVTFVP